MSPIHHKTIGYFSKLEYLSTILGKWASFAITNELLRTAVNRTNGKISGDYLMRLMTDNEWVIPDLDITQGIDGDIAYSGYYFDPEINQHVRIKSITRSSSG
jgi:hypothetical protein